MDASLYLLHPAGFEQDSAGDVTGDSLSVDEAFQVFNGRLYHTTKRTKDPTTAVASLRVDEREYFSLSEALERRSAMEAPLERFNRLRMELKDLQNDVDIMVEQEKIASSHKGNPSLWSVLQQEVLQLSQQAAPLQLRIESIHRTDTSSPDQLLDNLRKSISL